MNEELKKLLNDWKAKAKTGEMLKAKFCGIHTKDLGEGRIEAVVATSSLDRHGEFLDIAGVDTTKYFNTKLANNGNPVVLWAHDYQALPVAKAIGLRKTADGQMVATMEFAINEDEFAHKVYKMLKGGFLNAFSIGFIPTDVAEKDGHVVWTKSQMLEFSVVPVPANEEALQVAKSLGLKMKGAVADKLDEEQKREEKYKNMGDFWDLVYAFCDTYFAKEVEPGEFGTLLKELTNLMGSLADGKNEKSAVFPIKKIDSEEVAKFIIATKAGKVLSKANRDKVESAISALNAVLEADKAEEKSADDNTNNQFIDIAKKATSAMETLLSQATEGGAGRSPEKRKLLLVKAKKSAQIVDKTVELFINSLNSKLK